MAQYLDQLDKKILGFIANDARTPFLEIARACNVSGAAIHQRVQKLTNLGVLRGSQYIVEPAKIGYETCAYIGLYLKEPETVDKALEALQKMPEVVECHIITGDFDLFLKVYARNNKDLMRFIHNKLQPLGLARSETTISLSTPIERQVPVEGITVAEESAE